MGADWLQKALLFRFSRERRVARIFAMATAFWLVVAYALLPTIWRHYEGAPALAGRAMVTRTTAGIPGDPINLAFVDSEKDVICAFHAAGWRTADAITWTSSVRIVGSVIFDRPDPAAPVSPLLFGGRREDLAFEREDGRSADTRHHVRLWRAAQASETQPETWVGAATFDRGVGISRYTLQVTHHIAADVDAERDFVVADLARIGGISSVSEAAGVGPTLDGRNGGGDRYFTDGEIAFSRLSENCESRPGSTPVLPSSPAVQTKNRLFAWAATLWRRFR
jgi:hypothetical protein